MSSYIGGFVPLRYADIIAMSALSVSPNTNVEVEGITYPVDELKFGKNILVKLELGDAGLVTYGTLVTSPSYYSISFLYDITIFSIRITKTGGVFVTRILLDGNT